MPHRAAGLAFGAAVAVQVLLVAVCSAAEPASPAAADDAITAPPGRDPAPPDGPTPEAEGDVFEVTRDTARSTAEWLARSVDSWFGDKPFEDGGKVTDGRLSINVLHRKDSGNDTSVRFNARFRLPNVERKTYLYFGRDNFREVLTDKPGAFSRQDRLQAEQTPDRSFFAGLGYDLHETVDFRLGFRGGLKPYAQARYRRPWLVFERDLVEFRQTVFWSVDERFGSTTAASYEHAFTRDLALRWLNAATISEASRKFDWSSALGLFHALGGQRLWALEALLNGRQGSGVDVSEYGLQVRWQQPVHKDWVLGEVSLGRFWPRPDALSERGRVWAVGVGLKLKF